LLNVSDAAGPHGSEDSICGTLQLQQINQTTSGAENRDYKQFLSQSVFSSPFANSFTSGEVFRLSGLAELL